MSPTLQLRAASDAALEGAALNFEQRRTLFDPSPECDSLAEQIVALRHHGVPAPTIRELLAGVRTVLELNTREGNCHAEVAGELDRLGAALAGGNQLAEALTIKGLVRALRDPLSTLLSPEQATAAELVRARGAVREAIAAVPRDRLTSRSFARELGGRRHRLLLQLAGAAS